MLNIRELHYAGMLVDISTVTVQSIFNHDQKPGESVAFRQSN